MKMLLRSRTLLIAGIALWILPAAASALAATSDSTAPEKQLERKARKGDDKPSKDDGAKATEDPAAQASTEDEDLSIDPVQPDFTIVNLPTTLRVPNHRGVFRVIHRFTRPLGQGDFGDLASDFFGIDSGARIGLEFRFGLLPGTQVGVHRTNDRTIEFFGQHDFIQQGDRLPLSLDGVVSIEGFNNFREQYSAALGAIVSRKIGEHAALYVEPIWVGNTNPLDTNPADDNNTFMIGLGARVRIASTAYLVGELTPRVVGYDPGVNHGTFAFEKRVGGHVFQINFSNSFGTTLAQIARGGFRNQENKQNWYLGFNISRKFY